MMDGGSIPLVTGTQMAAVDRAMVEVCGLDLLQVMEVAGRAAAVRARLLARQAPSRESAIDILAGPGGNGGDALVGARYLWGWHLPVRIWLSRPAADYHGLAGHNLAVCRRLGIPITEPETASLSEIGRSVVIDGLFGFGLHTPIHGWAETLIRSTNVARARVLAIDLPSGIDADTGELLGCAIEAAETVTLGLPKAGLVRGAGPLHAGQIVIADIGIPAAAYAAAGVAAPHIFDTTEFVRYPGGAPELA